MFAAPRRVRPAPLRRRFLRSSASPRDDVRTSVSDPDLPPAWRRIHHELRQAVADPVWSIWLEPLSARSLEGGCLVVEAPEHLRPWVSGRFGRLLQTCAQRVLGPDAQVAIVGPDEAPAPAAPRPREDPLNPRLTFEQFVIGDSNRFAHGAALAV